MSIHIFLQNSKNPYEKNIGIQLSSYRQAIKNKNNYLTYYKVNNLINNIFPLWLKIQSNEEKAVEKWRKKIKQAMNLCDDKNITYSNYCPSSASKNMIEKTIAFCLSRYKSALNNKKMDIVTYPSVNKMINDVFPLWLKIQTEEEKATDKWNENIKIAKQICNEKNINYINYFPSQTSLDKNEQRLSIQINSYRGAIKGTNKHTVYTKITELINNIFPLWLKIQSNEEKWIIILDLVKEFINIHKHKPSQTDKNSEYKKLRQWLDDQHKKYINGKYIMKDPEIRKLWEEFITEHSLYFPDNPAIQKKPTPKSVSIKPTEAKEVKEVKETDEQRKTRTLSEYQELTKRMSSQKSETTKKMFQNDNTLWHKYHDCRDFSFKGYDLQDEIPINKIIAYLEKKSTKKLKILDLGCGRNLIKDHFKDNKKFDILGYDYVSYNNSIECDISKLPDENESVDICVFSQSLMGSNWKDYLQEALRVLKYNGEIIISESVDRYEDIKEHIKVLGYYIKKDDYDDKKRWFYLYVINDKV